MWSLLLDFAHFVWMDVTKPIQAREIKKSSAHNNLTRLGCLARGANPNRNRRPPPNIQMLMMVRHVRPPFSMIYTYIHEDEVDRTVIMLRAHTTSNSPDCPFTNPLLAPTA